jgi:hypothetical protein
VTIPGSGPTANDSDYRPLCPRSYADQPENHADPTGTEGWGICRTCGETVNTRGKYIPEHVDRYRLDDHDPGPTADGR